MQIHQAVEDLLGDGLDLVLVEAWRGRLSSLRRSCSSPIENASQTPAVNKWRDNSHTCVIGREGESRKHTGLSARWCGAVQGLCGRVWSPPHSGNLPKYVRVTTQGKQSSLFQQQ